ncbi:MAG: hypothetical protein EOO41_02845 [Methanobacteriota archaeon]|nr:MAG: hypothetical protein EOO41_02845 [Euryarchaeota archaeon]
MSLQLAQSSSTSVAFFGANMLLSKIRSEWSRLSSDRRQDFIAGMYTFLQAVMEGRSVVAPSVIERFAQALAAACMLTGEGALTQFMSLVVRLGTAGATNGQSLLTALHLLAAFGSEAFDRPHKHKKLALAVVRDHLDTLLTIMEFGATGVVSQSPPSVASPASSSSGSAATSGGVRCDALEPLSLTFLSSIRLTPCARAAMVCASKLTTAGLTLAKMQSTHPGLLACLLVAVGSFDSDTECYLPAETALVDALTIAGNELLDVTEAADFLPSADPGGLLEAAHVAQSVAHLSATTREPSGTSKTDKRSDGTHLLSLEDVRYTVAGFQSVMVGLAALQGHLKRAMLDDARDAVKTIARLTSCLIRVAPKLCMSGTAPAVTLLGMQLECATFPVVSVMEIAHEAWPSLLGVPRAERSTAFGTASLLRIVDAVLRSAAYPADFPVSGMWDGYDGEMSEDEFTRFREQVLAPALEVRRPAVSLRARARRYTYDTRCPATLLHAARAVLPLPL